MQNFYLERTLVKSKNKNFDRDKFTTESGKKVNDNVTVEFGFYEKTFWLAFNNYASVKTKILKASF